MTSVALVEREPGVPSRRRSHMRARFVLLLVLLTAALVPATSTATSSPAHADCAAPMLDLARGHVLGGDAAITVTGRYFKDGCQDVGSCTGVLGCQSCDYGPEPKPQKDLTLQLHQRGRTWDLATTDAAGETARARWTFRLPRGVRPGTARLTVDGAYAEPARVRIR